MTLAARASSASSDAPRRASRFVLIVLAGLLGASGILLATARPVAACSCAPPQPMQTYATAENAIFTGTAGPRDGRGVPVSVDRWLWGAGAAPVVWLAKSSFGDGAACGTRPPPAGSTWIWVTWLPGNRGDFGTGLCSPAGDLSTPEGRAMLDEAMAVFTAVEPPTPTAEPTPDAVVVPAPTPTPAPDPAAVARDSAGLTIAAALLAVTVALFGGLILLARRGSHRDRP